jgi:hypothetical protein
MIRDTLGEDVFAAAWQAGAGLTAEGAFALAIAPPAV